jgi:hypothetical protein
LRVFESKVLYMCVQIYLFSSVDLIRRDVFSNLNGKNRRTYFASTVHLKAVEDDKLNFFRIHRLAAKFFKFKSVRFPCLERT